MKLAILRRVRSDPALKALLGAALLLANEGGKTVCLLSEITGIPKASIRRYTRDARERRRRDPQAHLIYSAIAAGSCDHARLFADTEFSICLDCLASNQPDHPALRIYPGDMPKKEPSKKYIPDPRYKGGVG